jgi:hypothetical protein
MTFCEASGLMSGKSACRNILCPRPYLQEEANIRGDTSNRALGGLGLGPASTRLIFDKKSLSYRFWAAFLGRPEVRRLLKSPEIRFFRLTPLKTDL